MEDKTHGKNTIRAREQTPMNKDVYPNFTASQAYSVWSRITSHIILESKVSIAQKITTEEKPETYKQIKTESINPMIISINSVCPASQVTPTKMAPCQNPPHTIRK